MLREIISSRKRVLRFYGISPPKASNGKERNREIADIWIERLNGLGENLDGVIVYDLQDEPGRTGMVRPFPFLPTLNPLGFVHEYLTSVRAPKIIYKRVAGLPEDALKEWLTRLQNNNSDDVAVLVGSPSAQKPAFPRPEGLTLAAASHFARDNFPDGCFGGVAIAERHADKKNENLRLLAKYRDGCKFFVTQTVYDAKAACTLITDYARTFTEAEIDPPPLIFSFAPCGSIKTMEFMQWLGIRFPVWIIEELRNARDILSRSVALSETIGSEITAHARSCGVPTGMNVESISIRREEIDASCYLFTSLATGPYRPEHYRY